MTSNTFYLRDGYSTEEMIERIPAAKINYGVEGYEEAISEFGLSPSDFRNMNKSTFFERMREEMDEEFGEFVEVLFENCGQKGDKFNLQLYSLPSQADYSEVREEAETIVGSRIDEYFEGAQNVIMLDEVRFRDQLAVLDLGFRTAEEIEDVQPDEDIPIIIRRSDTDEIEAEYGEGYIVEAPTRQYIEARLYLGKSLLAVSRGGGISESQQKDIVRFINELSEPIEESQ